MPMPEHRDYSGLERLGKGHYCLSQATHWVVIQENCVGIQGKLPYNIGTRQAVCEKQNLLGDYH